MNSLFIPFLFIFEIFLILSRISLSYGNNLVIPIFVLDSKTKRQIQNETITELESSEPLTYVPFTNLVGKNEDSGEFWREMDILTLIQNNEHLFGNDKCVNDDAELNEVFHFPSRRTIRPICRSPADYQLCPQCPHYSNLSECELFRDSCEERRVHRSEYGTYCDRKYGSFRAMFIPADYSKCRCCDECVFYREHDQSCVHDDYNFDAAETLPVTSIDFRAGCNPYWGHPSQEVKALKCDKILRRCVPGELPDSPKHLEKLRQSYRYSAPREARECPMSCRGYVCRGGLAYERDCHRGAFLPDNNYCNCCGHCSNYLQLGEVCAASKKMVVVANGSRQMEVEEEFLEPGCDDGLVCHHGRCQDIHTVSYHAHRNKRDQSKDFHDNEPCKTELKLFKKKHGINGHLHHDAPQCTPLWLYMPVQCRHLICYCALEDGSFIEGIKVPRVEVSNMNCDCARYKCRTNATLECDGYGNYKRAAFVPQNNVPPIQVRKKPTLTKRKTEQDLNEEKMDVLQRSV